MNPDTAGSHLDWHQPCMAEIAPLFLVNIDDIYFPASNCKHSAKSFTSILQQYLEDPETLTFEALAFTLAIAHNLRNNVKSGSELSKISVGTLQQDFKTYYHKLCPDAPMLPITDITLFMKQVTDFVNFAGYSIDSTLHLLFVPENIFKVFLDEVEV